MAGQSNTPVIIKRKKIVAGDGHHGGAWKVAYADFVTAMMAFFLLMWLLGATTEKQRKGIADYFNPTIPVIRASGGGQGAFGGDSVYSEATLAQNGTGAGLVQPTEARQARGDTGTAEDEEADTRSSASTAELEEIEKRLLAASGESMSSDLIRRHIVTRISDEGLIIELFDTGDEQLFDDADGASDLLQRLIADMLPVLSLTTNKIAVNGYVRARPVVLRDHDAWARSARRADLVRNLIEPEALADRRVRRVTGFGETTPATGNPMDIRNNRVEIVLLRSRV